MSTLAFCIARRKAELPIFQRVLRALPPQRLDYRADPKARSAAELAWLLACEERALASVFESGVIRWEETPPPASLDEIVAAYERHAAEVDAHLARLDESGWAKQASFEVDGQSQWQDAVEHFVWGFLFDAIHHRGQLSTYLRPMGGKVPSIYGPSADDPGQ